jgi:hypothetical protein
VLLGLELVSAEVLDVARLCGSSRLTGTEFLPSIVRHILVGCGRDGECRSVDAVVE